MNRSRIIFGFFNNSFHQVICVGTDASLYVAKHKSSKMHRVFYEFKTNLVFDFFENTTIKLKSLILAQIERWRYA